MPVGLISVIHVLLTSIFQNSLANKCGAVGVVRATSDRITNYETIWIEKL